MYFVSYVHSQTYLTPCAQVDTGRELVRVTWGMMRSAINATYESVTAALDDIGLPGQVIAFVYVPI